MKLTLTRFAYSPLGTFGEITDGIYKAFTVEEVWRNNQKSKSCIPEGTYKCKRGQFPRHGNTFEVMNVPNRSAILFHVANTIDDIEGCIGLGDKLGALGGMWAVQSSSGAMRRFFEHTKDTDEFTLVITRYTPTKETAWTS